MLRMFLLRRAVRAELPRADWDRWHAARTLADLGELTAQWLEGTLANHPGYGEPGTATGPDPETTLITGPLAACNRAGLLTYQSQPAKLPTRGYDGAVWEQRAAIEALCDDHTLDWLYELAADAGLLVIVHRGARWRRSYRHVITVTRTADDDEAEFGTRLARSDLLLQFSACRPRLRWRLYRAWQVTIIDPAWGRNDRLWPLLDRLAATQHQHQRDPLTPRQRPPARSGSTQRGTP